MSKNLKKALDSIETRGFLLVFPIPNSKTASVWSELYPRSKMRWDWDVTADDRVVQLWQLRRELAESQKVFYTKWYRGRATVLSMSVFENLYRVLRPLREQLSSDAAEALELLEYESPLSTKQLRRGLEMTGKDQAKRYQSAVKELWHSLAIAGIGEIDDGAFPSLAHAATRVVFEEHARRSDRLNEVDAWADLNSHPEVVAFAKRLLKTSAFNP